MKTILYFIIAVFLLPITTSAGFFGASNYEECILENMKGVTSDQAARAIQISCRNKFPLEKKQTRHASDFPGYPFLEETRGHELLNRYILKYHEFIGYNPEKLVAILFDRDCESDKNLKLDQWMKDNNIDFL